MALSQLGDSGSTKDHLLGNDVAELCKFLTSHNPTERQEVTVSAPPIGCMLTNFTPQQEEATLPGFRPSFPASCTVLLYSAGGHVTFQDQGLVLGLSCELPRAFRPRVPRHPASTRLPVTPPQLQL